MIALGKDEKQLFYFAAFIIGAVILIIILKRYQMRKQESNYVMPRGFFQPIPAPTPPPAPPVVPPVVPPPSEGRSVGPGHSNPYPYPFPYPYPVYDFSVQPYVMVAPEVSRGSGCYKSVKIAGDEKETCFQSKADYVKFLKRSYNTFVDSYKDALYTLRFGKAAKISSVLRKIKSDIESEIGLF